MKKILSVLLVLTMVLSLGLTFAASAEEYTHPEYDVFAEAPAADLEHPFDAAIAAGTTPVEFKLSNPKYNYTYHPDGTATNPTIIKKVTGEGEAAVETVVDKETWVQDKNEDGSPKVDDAGNPVMVLDGTYNYYMVFDTITVADVMYVVVDTWEEIASLVRKGVGTQYTDINIVLKKDVTPLQQVNAEGWDAAANKANPTADNLQYHFQPAAEGVNNIPVMNLAGTDRVVVIDGNGYGWTNFSLKTAADNTKAGVFSGISANFTMQNIHIGTKEAPIEFAYKGESGLLCSWIAAGPVVTVDNIYLYMKGTGDSWNSAKNQAEKHHMGALVGNKSTGDNAGRYIVNDSMFAFEIIRTNHIGNHTGALGCAQAGATITDSDFYCYIVAGAGDNALVGANGSNKVGNGWDLENVNIYGYGYSDNNMSGVGGYTTSPCNFKNVNNYADMTVKSGSAAGFVGNYGAANVHVYENCINYGTITTLASNAYAGGFEGRAQGTVTMTNCANYGDIYAASTNAGGFFAECHGSSGAKTFVNCSNGSMEEPVYIEGKNNIGGFIGTFSGAAGATFTDCFNFAAILGTDNVGGFTGWTSGPATFTNCESIVSGVGNNVSGLVAKSYSGRSAVNPNEDVTPEQDADGDGIIDAQQTPAIKANGCKTIVYAMESNWVAPLVGTYYQYVGVLERDENGALKKDENDKTIPTGETVVIPWYGLDAANSTENVSNVDGDGIDAIMSMDEIVEFLGANMAEGLDAVEIGYEAAATDAGNFVRVFGTTAVLPAEYAGFTFSYTYTDENGVLTEALERTYWCAEVYNGLNGLDYSYTNEIPAAEEGGEPTLETVYPFGEFDACKVAGGYIWALTFENVPAGMVTITVKAFADDNTSRTIEIVLENGNEYEAPVVPEGPVEGETGVVEQETAPAPAA